MKKAVNRAVMCALAIGLAFVVPGTMATAAVARPVPQAGYTTFPGRLYSVAAVSANNVWAVGLEPSNSLIVHWNGKTWSRSLTGPGYFESVSASSPGNVWAVGGTNWFSPTRPLAEHWNGSSWTKVAVPNPAGGGLLNAVAATSASNAWAVGSVGPGPGGPPASPLIEHWNGTRWTIQGFQGSWPGGSFTSVAAVSPRNAWAVGSTGPNSKGTGQHTLIEHWDGKTWNKVPSPNVGSSSILHSVTIISAGHVWAVGQAEVGSLTKALVLYWNGSRWTVVPSRSPGGDASLLAVAASYKQNVWAVGYRNPSRCSNGGPKCATLIEHWNSIHSAWRLSPSPNPPSAYINILLGISAVSRTDIWAVGSTDFGSTLIIHWNGTSWS